MAAETTMPGSARACPKCGASVPAEAAFCGECGAATPPAKEGTVPGEPIEAALKMSAPPLAPPLAPPAGAPKPAKQRHLPAGTLVDHKYSISRVLGEGGMGVVYLARDVHTGLDVVVKAVRPELAHRDDVRERTLAEGRALARIDHPNVVHLNAVVVDDSNLWLVMQYIEGESLDKTIKRLHDEHKRMPLAEALGIWKQIALGIGAAHREGMIHRDLKPANVLIRAKDGTAKVTDFGIAKVPRDTSREQTKGILGSLWYMSPEQVTGRRDLDTRVDIYALGIVLYQMLVGRVPFDAASDYELMRMHAQVPMPRVRADRPDIPEGVDEIIQKCCAKDRANRYANVEELLVAVDSLARPARTEPGPPPAATASYDQHGPSRPLATTAHGSISLGATGPQPTLSVAPSRSPWIAVVLVAVGFAAIGVILVVTNVVRVPGLYPGPRPPRSAGTQTTAHPTTSVAPSGSAHVEPPKTGLAALEGTWAASGGRSLEAVLSGDVLEFRVSSPADFAPQDYQAKEARFALRATAEPNVYAVEDRLRPNPPDGVTWDPRSRTSCQAVWTTIGSDPLRARFDGARLTVELAKIQLYPQSFKVKDGAVIACVDMDKAKATKIVSTLDRQKTP